jgi:hypothetical protein
LIVPTLAPHVRRPACVPTCLVGIRTRTHAHTQVGPRLIHPTHSAAVPLPVPAARYTSAHLAPTRVTLAPRAAGRTAPRCRQSISSQDGGAARWRCSPRGCRSGRVAVRRRRLPPRFTAPQRRSTTWMPSSRRLTDQQIRARLRRRPSRRYTLTHTNAPPPPLLRLHRHEPGKR